MKLFFCLKVTILSCLLGKAQEGISVIYKRTYSDNYGSYYSRFVTNDSFAYYYFMTGHDPLKKEKVFYSKMIHHALFTNKTEGYNYWQVDYPKGNTKIIRDTIRYDSWTPFSTSKKILGYECLGLERITEDGKKIRLWYSPVLKYGIGNPNYFGLPGLLMEVIDERYGWTIKAKSVKKADYKFILPAATIETSDIFYKRRQNK